MKDTHWYSDESARRAYLLLQAELMPLVANLFPGYKLSHAGFNRNNVTQEVQIKLHLLPRDQVRDYEPDTVDLKLTGPTR